MFFPTPKYPPLPASRSRRSSRSVSPHVSSVGWLVSFTVTPEPRRCVSHIESARLMCPSSSAEAGRKRTSTSCVSAVPWDQEELKRESSPQTRPSTSSRKNTRRYLQSPVVRHLLPLVQVQSRSPVSRDHEHPLSPDPQLSNARKSEDRAPRSRWSSC